VHPPPHCCFCERTRLAGPTRTPRLNRQRDLDVARSDAVKQDGGPRSSELRRCIHKMGTLCFPTLFHPRRVAIGQPAHALLQSVASERGIFRRAPSDAHRLGGREAGSELTGPLRAYGSAHFGPGLATDTNYSD
jgi:hypothetical protein